MSNKRIAILVAGLPPIYNGGTEIATTYIAKFAALAGHEVHVIAFDGTKLGKKLYESKDGYIVHRVQTITVSYLYGLGGLYKVFNLIRKIKPDIIHAQGSQMALLAFFASRMTKTPFIMYGRGEIYVKWMLRAFFTKLLMRNATRVIAQTEHMRAEMYEYINNNFDINLNCRPLTIEVIPNGIDINMFGKFTKEQAREKLGLPLSKGIVIWVGNDRPEKNLSCFIKAQEWFDKSILPIIVSKQPYEKVLLYMAAADVLVNTSYSEGFPMTVLEALASGLPIVAPNVCGISEIVEDGINGLLVKSNNLQATASAINEIIGDKQLAAEMAENNLKKAKTYRWQNVVEKLYGQGR